MNKFFSPLVIFSLLSFQSVSAQVGVAVNATGADPTTGTMLDVTSLDNTSSSYGIRVNTSQFAVRGDGNVGIGILPQNDIRLHTESFGLGTGLNNISIAQQWGTPVGGNYQYLRTYSRRSAAGSGWGSSDLYLQRFVDGDGNAMGFIKWSGGDWGIELGSGSSTHLKILQAGNVGIGTLNPQSILHVKGNAGILNIEGADHSYVQWYPDGAAAGRKAYTGFPGASSNDFTVANEIAGGRVDLTTNGGSVRVNSLSGAGTRFVTVDGNGTMSASFGGWTKVYEATLGAATQHIDIAGLDLDIYKVYEIYFTAGSTGGSEVRMYFNGNFTDNNYDCQHGHFYAGSTGMAHRDYPEIGTFTGATSLFVNVKVSRGPDGRARYTAHEVEMCSGTHGEHLYGGVFLTNANVTSIRIRNVSANFTAGTRVIIMGLY